MNEENKWQWHIALWHRLPRMTLERSRLVSFPSSNWHQLTAWNSVQISMCFQCDRHWSWIFTNRFIIFISSTSGPGPCFWCCSSWPRQLSVSQQYRSSFDRLKIQGSQKSQNLRVETQCGHERLRMSDPSHSSKGFLKVWVVWRNSSTARLLRQLVVPFHEDLFSQRNRSKPKGPTSATAREQSNTASSPRRLHQSKGLRKVLPFFRSSKHQCDKRNE